MTSRATTRPDPDALLARDRRAKKRAPRAARLQDLLRRLAGRRQDLRDARPRRAPLREQGVDVVIGVVETHGRSETAALLAGLELLPRKRRRLSRPRAAGVRSRRRARAQAGAAAGRRARAHQRARLAPSEALAGRRGAARRRHRRLHDGQRPAPREPERRRRRHHRRARARDACPTASSIAPTRSCWSTCRPTSCCSGCRRARSTCPSRPSARAQQLLPQGQPDRAARARAAPHRRARRRRRCSDYRARHSRSARVWKTREALLVCVGPAPRRRSGGARGRAPGRAARCATGTPSMSRRRRCSGCRTTRRERMLRDAEARRRNSARETATLAGSRRAAALVAYARAAQPRHAWSWARRTARRGAGHGGAAAAPTRSRQPAPDLDVLVRQSRRVRASGLNAARPASRALPRMARRRLRRRVCALSACVATPSRCAAACTCLELPNIVMLFLLARGRRGAAFGRGPAVLAAFAQRRWRSTSSSCRRASRSRSATRNTAHVRGDARRRPRRRPAHRGPALPGARRHAARGARARAVRDGARACRRRSQAEQVVEIGARLRRSATFARAGRGAAAGRRDDRLPLPAPDAARRPPIDARHRATGPSTTASRPATAPTRCRPRLALSAAEGADAHARRAGDASPTSRRMLLMPEQRRHARDLRRADRDRAGARALRRGRAATRWSTWSRSGCAIRCWRRCRTTCARRSTALVGLVGIAGASSSRRAMPQATQAPAHAATRRVRMSALVDQSAGHGAARERRSRSCNRNGSCSRRWSAARCARVARMLAGHRVQTSTLAADLPLVRLRRAC